MSRTLVAGIGNVFFGDDGFGCAVARRLGESFAPAGVSVVDFGIRGVHLAFELTSGYDTAVIIDAVARGGRAGTLYVLDPELDGMDAPPIGNAHSVALGGVLAMMRTLGAPPARVVVVGCEAGEIVERIGLSDAVAEAVEPAAALVKQLLADGAQAVAGGHP
jgi:hydrogenase maturation protease